MTVHEPGEVRRRWLWAILGSALVLAGLIVSAPSSSSTGELEHAVDAAGNPIAASSLHLFSATHGEGEAGHVPAAGDGSWAPVGIGTTHPPGRAGAVTVLDNYRRRVVVFGGYDGTSYLNDVWELPLDGAPIWQPISPAGPPPIPRTTPAAIFDADRRRLLIFGGYSASGYLADLWELDLTGPATWRLLSPDGPVPPARTAASAVYDAAGDRMLVFGGSRNATFFQDTWGLSLAGTLSWQTVATGLPLPSGRQYAAAVHDPVRDRVVLYGGYDGTNLLDDLWTLDLVGTPAWSQATPIGPTPGPRMACAAVYDPSPERDRVLVFGGSAPGSLKNDCWSLPLAAGTDWRELQPLGTPPTSRWGPAGIFDPARDRVVLCGGITGAGYTNDVWALLLGGGSSRPWPALRLPPRDAVIDASVEFGWQALPDVGGYQVVLAPSSTLSHPIWSSTTTSALTATYRTGPEFIPGQTYHWSVRARFAEGWGPWAPPRPIQRLPLGDPLAAPVDLVPVDGEEVDLPDDFSWAQVAGATSYEIQVSSRSDFLTETARTRVSNAFVRLWDGAARDVGVTYFWRVRALAGRQVSPWSSTASFARAAAVEPPSMPIAIAPAADALESGPNVVFSWERSARATSYTLTYSKSPLFLALPGVTWTVDLRRTSITVPFSGSSTNLWWRVVARNSGGISDPSALRRFHLGSTAEPLSGVTLLTPAPGAVIVQNERLLASAVVSGRFEGTVTVLWLLDGAPFATSDEVMSGEGFTTPTVVVPTSTLGPHELVVRVMGPSSVESNPLELEIITRTYGPAARVAVTPEDLDLAPGESTILHGRVLDAQGRLVENDHGRSIALLLEGVGSLPSTHATTSSGRLTLTYVAPVDEVGEASISISSPGLIGGSTRIRTRALALERLQEEARGYLARLSRLSWSKVEPSQELWSSFDVEGAQTLVDGAAPSDEPRLRRLNLFLRLMDRSWYYDYDINGGGPIEGFSHVPGAQLLIDDGVRSLGHLCLSLLSGLTTIKNHPVLSLDTELVLGIETLVISGLDLLVDMAIRNLDDVEDQKRLQQSWDELTTAIPLTADFPTLALVAFLDSPARYFLANGRAVRDFVDPGQFYLDHVVTHLAHPDWTGGPDAVAEAFVEEKIKELHEKSTHHHNDLNATMERAGLVEKFADLQSVLAATVLASVNIPLRISEAVNRLLAATLVWASGFDCQTIANRIAAPGFFGAAADAVLRDYAAEASGPIPWEASRDSREGPRGSPVLSLPRLAAAMAEAGTSRDSYEDRLRELEASLTVPDITAARAALGSLVQAQAPLLDRWRRLAGTVGSASAAARRRIPDFEARSAELRDHGLAALGQGFRVFGLTTDWLEAPEDGALSLTARIAARDAADAAILYHSSLTSLIERLFDTPSAGWLFVERPEIPATLANGETAVARCLVRNVGASTAHGISVSIVTDSTRLHIIGQRVMNADSLAPGDSLECTWNIRRVRSGSPSESGVLVMGTIAARANDAGSSNSRFVLGPDLAELLSTPDPPVTNVSTRLIGVRPNPATGRQKFELFVPRAGSSLALEVYSVDGRLVWSRKLSDLPAGRHEVAWDGRTRLGKPAPPLIYFVVLEADGRRQTIRFVRLR